MAAALLQDLDVTGKRVLVRVDFNVPLTEGRVGDDTRIRAALPTLRFLIERGARVILMSHLGRPKGVRKPEFSLAPVAVRTSELLGRKVRFAPDCIGPDVEALAEGLAPGEVLLLENLRFHPEEEKNEAGFAEALSRLGEVYVNDAFGTAHRAHASTEGVARRIPVRAAGFLMDKELRFLQTLLSAPERPYVVLLGGAKVSGKISVIESLLPRLDALLIGGAMMFTFWRAKGLATGHSLVEEEQIPTAQSILRRAEELGKEVLLPVDCVAAVDPQSGATGRVVGEGGLTPEEGGYDIGPATCALFSGRLAKARTVFWNGPMGICEQAAYARGTLAMAEAVVAATGRGATTVVGGGDSVAAVNRMGVADRISHVSTGGGASLEFLEGRVLPGVAALEV